MRILLVDDEAHAVSDHINTLRGQEIEVEYVESLQDAFDLLTKAFSSSDPSARFDLVLIDLLLDFIPRELAPFYSAIEPGTQNQGQALGQWLWDCEGAHCKASRPMHCYFTNTPDNYRPHTDSTKQEFGPLDPGTTVMTSSHVSLMLLEKWTVPPSKIIHRIQQVTQQWQSWSKAP